MGKPSATLSDKNQPLKKGYPTLNSVIRKIKKGYITKNGVWQVCYSGGVEFTYDGIYKFAGNPDDDWELALLTGGSLKFNSLNCDAVDIFLIGGGQNGKAGYWNSGIQLDQGGGGGDGGNYKTVSNVAVSEGVTYPAVVGTHSGEIEGRGTASTIFGKTSAGGAYKTGPNNPGRDGNRNGANGVLAFNGGDCLNYPGRLFGASGAASGSCDYRNPTLIYFGGTGGTTGGGNGGDGVQGAGVRKGSDASANTGSGGGGAGMGNVGANQYGKGGSGIILVRPHRA